MGGLSVPLILEVPRAVMLDLRQAVYCGAAAPALQATAKVGKEV